MNVNIIRSFGVLKSKGIGLITKINNKITAKSKTESEVMTSP